jgi:hypothetical protein
MLIGLALFDDLMGGSFHKIFVFHLSSLAKLLYKHILMHFCAFFPNPSRFIFVD